MCLSEVLIYVPKASHPGVSIVGAVYYYYYCYCYCCYCYCLWMTAWETNP